MAYIHEVVNGVQVQPGAVDLETTVRLSQNENGRKLYFKILGIDEIPSGAVATFSGTKPDGVVYSTTGTIDGVTIIVNEDTQMTAVAGSWDAKVRITSGSNTVASAKVRMVIEPDVVASGSIPSDSQLDGIVAECQFYAENARSDAYGSPLVAQTAAAMIDTTRVYVYAGSETGYIYGNWYYHDGTSWVSGGAYGATIVEGIVTKIENGVMFIN